MWNDLRGCWRQLGRRPGFSLLIVLTLGLGIGAASSVFSLVYGILLKPYPYREPEALVRVETVLTNMAGNRQGASLDELTDWREQARTFAAVGGWLSLPNTISLNNQAQAVNLTFVSAETFPALGVKPLLGRNFLSQEDVIGGDVKKTILSHALWSTYFQQRPDIIGQVIEARGDRYTVVGVMQPGFRFPEKADLWVPLMARYAGYQATWWKSRSYREHQAIARMKPGVTIEQAQAEMNALANAAGQEFPATNQGVRYQLTALREAETADISTSLWLLFGATGMVLLIGGINAANLLLVRAAGREKETIIRAALGAGSWDVFRLAVLESTVLALSGGMVGIALAYGFTLAFPVLAPVELPFWMSVSLNWPVVIFCLGLALLVGVLLGLAPALQTLRTDLMGVLRQGARGSSGASGAARRLRDGLVIGEVTLSFVLLIGAGLMTRSFLALQKVDMGVKQNNVACLYVARFVPNATREELLREYTGSYRKALQRLGEIPNVVSVAAATDVPYSLFGKAREQRETLQFTVRGQSQQESFRNGPAQVNYISPGYFATLGVPLRSGRDFTELDDTTKPNYIIINQHMADTLFPGGLAVGQELRWGNEGGFSTVIGVAANIRYSPFETEPGFEVYYSYHQIPMPQMKILVEVAGNPASLLPALRAGIRAADPRIAIVEASTLSQLAGKVLWQRRLWGILFGAFAFLALFLAGLGLYGVIAYLVEQRQREIGIRMALGASTGSVVALVGRQAGKLVAAGLLAGVVLAAGWTRFLGSLLFGVGTADPITYAAVLVLLSLTAILACTLPALRATRIDPAVAFRED